MLQAQHTETINSTWKVSVSFNIIMMTIDQHDNSDVRKTFFKTKINDQDPYFKTKTKPNVQIQDQHFASQDQDLFVIYITEADRKCIFHFRP